MDAAYEALRLEILKRAEAHAAELSGAGGRAWRVGDIAFGAGHDAYGDSDPDSFRRRVSPKGAYRDETEAIFAEMDAEEGDREAVAGAERISLMAAVTLKAAVASDAQGRG